MPDSAPSLRARVRAEMTEEIKRVALRHLATDGTALSLRAVARDLGMVSSALYRYFANRDELLTALIVDAYNVLAEEVERADAAVTDRADVLGRWLAVGHAIRAWAVAKPHEYALIYGSPIPGYAAPTTTIEPATRPVLVLGGILADARSAGVLPEKDVTLEGGSPLGHKLRAEIETVAEVVGAEVDAAAVARALLAWTELFGAVGFEVFGRLNNVIAQREEWFDWQLRSMARFIGLGNRS
ncbi:MAG TPA: TetR/AcrR family transcriptional regulator [Actinocrinis sp.]|uniref:TetR/AcrR family transcriptional regulator n=1 Tax=Actinocrinis sp. TaxID=1920516 RepID=UPI002DDCF27E|nr:TetR/AcrR family transcriptional regulator [Actinocrinis sp.]HEV3168811.1 TetR/AcrR family transcriptional regulator [Actinocrinis sp.]